MSRFPWAQMIARVRPGASARPNWGTTTGAVAVVVMAVPLSSGLDAAHGLGEAGDVSHLLGRLLGEQAEQVPDRHPTAGRCPPERRGLAALGEVVSQERQHRTVLVGPSQTDLCGK